MREREREVSERARACMPTSRACEHFVVVERDYLFFTAMLFSIIQASSTLIRDCLLAKTKIDPEGFVSCCACFMWHAAVGKIGQLK